MPKAKPTPAPKVNVIPPRDNVHVPARDFFDALQKTQKGVQQEVTAVVRKIAAVPQEVQDKARQELIEAINTYVEALKNAFGKADAAIRMEEAWRNYNAAIQQMVDHAQKRVADALQDYFEKIQILPEQARKDVAAAYAEYLSTLQQTFVDRDVAAAEPETLAAVAQSMLVVAASARPVLR